MKKAKKPLTIKMHKCPKGDAIQMKIEVSEKSGNIGVSVFHERCNTTLWCWLTDKQAERLSTWLLERP